MRIDRALCTHECSVNCSASSGASCVRHTASRTTRRDRRTRHVLSEPDHGGRGPSLHRHSHDDGMASPAAAVAPTAQPDVVFEGVGLLFAPTAGRHRINVKASSVTIELHAFSGTITLALDGESGSSARDDAFVLDRPLRHPTPSRRCRPTAVHAGVATGAAHGRAAGRAGQGRQPWRPAAARGRQHRCRCARRRHGRCDCGWHDARCQASCRRPRGHA